ncbi:hypothetical protein [Labrenzia sp. 011]|uniref:hypothetical protein n=1 Tax=Labrenzia sp. 011 TaxID=2171494 RepID=UPI001402CDA1|nr:hypothetical protein [Labrenzia sp. 011]
MRQLTANKARAGLQVPAGTNPCQLTAEAIDCKDEMGDVLEQKIAWIGGRATAIA